MVITDKRVSIVDGFRCIAILAVISYHYLYRFSPPIFDRNCYPYEYEPSILRYGFFGVQLFFIISGFVIFQTLGKTKSFKEFAIKRLIRLWPTMVLCSLLTFLIVWLLGTEGQFQFLPSISFLDFLPGWTFTPPEFWNSILNQQDISYVDGVYWSLFTEIVFYFFGGLIFFIKPKSFLTNWLWVTLIVNGVRIVSSPKARFLFPESLEASFDVTYDFYLNLNFGYWIYFALGVFFYCLYSKEKPSRMAMAIMTSLILLELYFLRDNTLRILFIGIIGLFSILVFRESWLSVLKWKVFVWIGLVSYPLYLLHQVIGLILIDRIAVLTGNQGAMYLPFIVTIAMIVLSSAIFSWFEKPMTSFLKARFTKNL